MTLLSLASRQIWPQVLAVLRMRPSKLVLFHSQEEAESRRPAERLREFFRDTPFGDYPVPGVDLELVPHNRFHDIIEAIASVAERLCLDGDNCQVHLTGGNKLMAMAAAEWCRRASVSFFYLERDLRAFPFRPVGPNLEPQPDYPLDPHLAREVDAVALLRCQIDAAEITCPGQRLVLNSEGHRIPESEFQNLLKRNHDFRRFLTWNHEDPENRAGDGLEYGVAFALLKLGVPTVYRSVRLAPRVLRGTGMEEGELDLVFNWRGKLWVVDCKDRHSADSKVDQLRLEMISEFGVSPKLDRLLTALADEIRERDLKPLKEDLLITSEAAGLLGRALCVRRSEPPRQARQFAESRGLPILLKERLLQDLRTQLLPR